MRSQNSFSFVIKLVMVCCLGLVFLAETAIAAPNKKPVLPEQVIKPHTKGKLLIKFRRGSNFKNARKIMRNVGARSIRAFKVPPGLKNSEISNWRVITVPNAVDLRKLRERLLKNRNIEEVEFDYEININVLPNDLSFNSLWGLRNAGQTGGTLGADIQAEAAWNINTGSGISSPLVAVIDTGIDYNHPDLIDNVWVNPGEIPGNGIDDDNNGYVDDIHGYDFVNNDNDPFDDNGHGTHVAGTIAAVGNNGIGVVGVNWKARVMAAKFLDAGGSGSTIGAIDAVLYTTAAGAKITNNSWGGGGFSQALEDAISAANAAGSLFVAAAGNSGIDTDITPNYPSNYNVENIISVAATDHNDLLATFSNYGATTVDIAAPGVDILSTTPGNNYSIFSGTSMATPHVVGVAALVLDFYPDLTVSELKSRILGGATAVTILNNKVATGGRLNALNSLDTDSIAPSAIIDLAVENVTARNVTLTWSSSGDDDLNGVASAYDVRYSTSPITETNFAAATSAGTAAGTIGLVSFNVTSLKPGTSYFFAVKAIDNVGNTSLISNLVQATSKATQIIFVDNFELGLNNWLIEGSDGVGGPALWHLGTHRNSSPVNALYYGKDSTLTYNTGATNFGSATSSTFNLTGQIGTTLSFEHFLQTEGFSPFDTARVNVSTDGGVTWTTEYSNALGSNGVMSHVDIDLSSYDNQIIQIQFDFNTGDGAINDFEGWVIDDVELSVTSQEVDVVPPASITDINVLSSSAGEAFISWAASGDDEFIGKAVSYDLRYSTFPIDESNFAQATSAGTLPVTGTAGSAESFTVTGLIPGQEYFFAIKTTDDFGNISTLSTVVSEIIVLQNNIYFKDDMETGTANWNITGTDGLGGASLWHIGTHRFSSPTSSFYYGIDGILNFDTGATNSGEITSIPIDLTTATKPILNFKYYLENEGGDFYDLAFVSVVFNGGVSTDRLYQALNTPSGVMLNKTLDLSSYIGQQIQLQFSFNTVDGVLNGFEGWVVDDVAVVNSENFNNPPVVSVIANTQVNKNQIINFDAGGTSDLDGDLLTYKWYLGDGTIKTGPFVSHSYSESGTYFAKLYVSDGKVGVSYPVDVNVINQQPVVNLQSPDSVFEGASITMDASLSIDPDGDALTYSWGFGDGSVATGAIVNHIYQTKGTYTVTLSVSDGESVSFASKSISVLTTAPTAVITSVDSTFINTPEVFDASLTTDPNGDPLLFDWEFGEGQFASGVIVNHAYALPGTYTVALHVSDGNNPPVTVTKVVTVLAGEPVVQFASTDSTFINTPEVFDASLTTDPNGDPLLFDWEFGDGQFASGVVVNHAYTLPGTYTVALHVSDGNNPPVTITKVVTVLAGEPVVQFASTDSTFINTPEVFDASLTTDPNGDPLLFDWEFGDGQFANGVVVNHAYALPGTYTVALHVSDGNNTPVTVTKVVTVLAGEPTAVITSVDTINKNENAVFDASLSADPNGDPLLFSWEFGDGTSSSGVIVNHTYAASGSYTVTLRVFDGNTETTVTKIVTVSNQAPVAVINSVDTVNKNVSMVFDASLSSDSNSDVLTYSWDFGDGVTATGVTVNHTYSTTGMGMATVTLTVSDGESSSSTSKQITIVNHEPTPIITSPDTLDKNVSAVFDASLSTDFDGDTLTYHWNFGDGGLTSTSAIVNRAYTISGSYTVTLTVSDGATSASTSKVITVGNQAPTPVITAAASVNKKVSTTFDASLSTDLNSDVLTYSWDFGDGVTATGVTVSHIYTASGSYLVTLTVNDGELSTTTSQNITVLNQAPVAMMTGPDTVNKNHIFTLEGALSSDADGDVLTYTWDYGDGTISTGALNFGSHSYSTSGNFTATLTVSDGESSTSVSKVITSTNTAPVAVISQPGSVNKNVNAAFDASFSSDFNQDTLSYAWNFGDGLIATGSNVNHAYSTSGKYTVTLTVSDGESSTITSKVITVINQAPVANAGTDQIVVQKDTITLDGSASNDPDVADNIASYQWAQVSGKSVTLSNANNEITTFEAPLVKSAQFLELIFELTVTDEEGLISKDTVTVIVNKK